VQVALRHRLAVDAMLLAGHESVLEIGCGQGVATRLVLARLTSGKLVALDRSPKLIGLVEAGLRDALAEGRLSTRQEALEDAEFGDERFNVVLAINVDLNLRLGDSWAPMIMSLLAPKGRIVLAFEAPPGSSKGKTFADLSRQRLEAAGLQVEQQVEAAVTVLVARNR
jgi:cyclopropane fatty-acyl-phospholipid synthase-like methyltransferase